MCDCINLLKVCLNASNTFHRLSSKIEFENLSSEIKHPLYFEATSVHPYQDWHIIKTDAGYHSEDNFVCFYTAIFRVIDFENGCLKSATVALLRLKLLSI